MKKSASYKTNLQTELEKSCAYDPYWNASMPYPTNPFTRVRPSELEKLGKKQKPTDLTSLGKALL